MNEASQAQHAILRRYLKDWRVSTTLKVRITGWLQAHTNTKSIHWGDIKILSFLPNALIADLQDECFAPVITKHPFFSQLYYFHHRLLRRLFPMLTERSLTVGRELFGPNDPANRW